MALFPLQAVHDFDTPPLGSAVPEMRGAMEVMAYIVNGIAYDDDSHIRQVTVALAYDKQKPRIEIAVAPL
ncbi:hypothetical protein [Nitrobacter sp. TKz-YC02]|uniref:hypothetical protein n=1 Tax=Nitrobacter sp. TKz-YC02 TaxID=3398704 RepID=UPI003CF1846E